MVAGACLDLHADAARRRPALRRLAAAQVSAHQQAANYAEIALDSGVRALQNAKAQRIAENLQSFPTQVEPDPSGLVLQRACQAGCALYTTVSWAQAEGSSAAADTAHNLQATYLGEARQAEAVTATVTTSAGDVVATRTRYVTFRLFNVPPYALIVAQTDSGAAINTQPGTAPGDTGGLDPASGTADTRISVRLACRRIDPQNDQDPAANDGLPWGVGANNHNAHEALCNEATSPVDHFTDGSWSNQNLNTSGWSR